MNPFLAEMLMKERVENALREAEQARLVKMAQKSKETRPFLPSAIQFIRDWWKGRNGRHQPTLDNMKQRKRHQTPVGYKR
jgi:hypothetical protein